MTNNTLKPLVAAIGAAMVGSLALGNAQAAENPFGLSELSSGYLQIASNMEGKCGGDKTMAEGKCGGDKTMAEGKCGGDKTMVEGKCGGDKTMAEGKCGGDKTMVEGKCGGSK